MLRSRSSNVRRYIIIHLGTAEFQQGRKTNILSVNLKSGLLVQLSLHHFNICNTGDAAPTHLSISHSISPSFMKKTPKILELLHWGKQLSPDPDLAIPHFPAKYHGLRFRGESLTLPLPTRLQTVTVR